MMEQPVQDRGRQDLIVGKDGRPVPDMLVRGEHDAAPFVARRDETEEEVRLGTVEGPEADFVDNQERRVEVALRAQPGRRYRRIRPQRVHEIIEHEVRDREAVLDRPDPEGGRQMTLSHTGRTKKQDVGLLANEAARREGLDLAPIDVRLKAPVEILERLARREAGQPQHRRDAALVLAIQLAAQDELQEAEAGRAAPAPLVRPVPAGSPQDSRGPVPRAWRRSDRASRSAPFSRGDSSARLLD